MPLTQIKIGSIRKDLSNEIPNEDDFIDAMVLIELDGIRMASMVQAEEGKKFVVEINYFDGTTITLGAHIPEIGDPDVWDQIKCAEVINQIFLAG